MRFGKSAQEAAEEPARGSGGGDYIRYLRNGDTTFRILQDSDEWIYYWEHFNPGGYAFPCTNDRDTCPGCTSDVQKMKSASRQAVFHALNKWEGQEYVNVYKVPTRVADKLKNRQERIGTLTDRDYTITKYKGANDKVDYDIEGNDKEPLKIDEYRDQFKDVEEMLAEAYNQSWGDPDTIKQTNAKANEASADAALKEKVAGAVQRQMAEDAQSDDPPSEPEAKSDTEAEGEAEVKEDDLRKMEPDDLRKFCIANGWGLPPVRLKTADALVDWMMSA